jgi:uncharacterized protein YecT (DUF1311 family)
MKRSMLSGVVIVAGLLLPVRTFADDALPKDWKPNLDLVARSIEKDLEQSTAQQEMNLLSGLLAQVKDAELAVAYLRLYSSLGDKKRKQLKAEQSKWLKKRDQAVEELGPHGSSRGSMAPMEDNHLFIDLTEKRIKELRRRSK